MGERSFFVGETIRRCERRLRGGSADTVAAARSRRVAMGERSFFVGETTRRCERRLGRIGRSCGSQPQGLDGRTLVLRWRDDTPLRAASTGGSAIGVAAARSRRVSMGERSFFVGEATRRCERRLRGGSAIGVAAARSRRASMGEPRSSLATHPAAERRSRIGDWRSCGSQPQGLDGRTLVLRWQDDTPLRAASTGRIGDWRSCGSQLRRDYPMGVYSLRLGRHAAASGVYGADADACRLAAAGLDGER